MTRARAALAFSLPAHSLAPALVAAVAALAVPVATGQTLKAPRDAVGFGNADDEEPSAAPNQPRVVMLTKPFKDIRSVLEPWGGEVVDTVPKHGFHLAALPAPLSDTQLDAIVEVLASNEITLLVEKERKAMTPELLACGYPSSVIQQCTIGIVDGEPTQAELESQSWLEQIGVPDVSAHSPGQRVVAVIDTGVDPGVPWLRGRVLPGWDFVNDRPGGYELANGVDDDGDGQVDEGYGHGTHIASTIGLIDPNALILPMRTMDSDGNGSSYFTAKAVILATLEGASVINLSLSFLYDSEFLRIAVAFAVHYGVDVYTSAGNTAQEFALFPATDISEGAVLPTLFPLPPESFPTAVVAVGAVDDSDVVSDFSAFGSMVEVWAPGEEIVAAFPGGEYGSWSGTSMSCAVASGVGSLARSLDPGDEPKAELLVQTAVEIAAHNQTLDGEFSGGRVDAIALIQAVLDELEPAPVAQSE